MQALFVHGMGRSPISGWHLMARLKAQGVVPHAFGYTSTFQRFDAIRIRLAARIHDLSADGEIVLIGHSLGGLLLRAAMTSLPPGSRPPVRLFLLGSPIQSSKLARVLQRNWFFRALAGDCGQRLASPSGMADIAQCSVPVTSILGVTGWTGRLNPFDGELNDGIVSVSEAGAAWITDEIRIPTIHTYLPSSRRVAEIILDRIAHPVDAGSSTRIG
ncbi:MAG TPA: alpha/beta fold hydrolase [Thiobacillus sp.]